MSGMLRRRAMMGGEILPSIPYVLTDCVAMWDGIWNAGIGQHSTVRNDLKELIHDEPAGTWGSSIEANCFSGVKNTQAAVQFASNFDLSSYTMTTWELVFRISQLRSQNAGSFMTQGGSTVLECYSNPTTSSTPYYTVRVNNTQTQTSTRVLADNALHTLTMVGISGTGATLYLDGTLIGTKTSTAAISLTKKQAQCSTGGHVAKIYQFRIYGRMLTAEEMAANRQVDINRFS